MDVSPFPYQGPLEPQQVRGRASLVSDLTERLTEHRVTALLGPRRYGKTSVLRRVTADMISAGVAVVWVDLYEVASLADLASRIDDALARVPGTFATEASKIAATASLNLGLVRVELRTAPRDRADPLLMVHALLDVLTRTALVTPTVLVIDEFSGIARVEGGAGLLRTHLQHHYQDMGIVFAGSAPSTMRMLFEDQALPFYAQADLLDIAPLSDVEVIDLVNEGFARSGRSGGQLAGRLAAFVHGHPQRAMQLADAAWRLVPARGEAGVGTWEEASSNVIAATADGNERLYSDLNAGERDVLRILAAGGSLFGQAADLLDLSTGTAQHARQRLLDRGHLVKSTSGTGPDSYRLVDPVFAEWIRRRFDI